HSVNPGGPNQQSMGTALKETFLSILQFRVASRRNRQRPEYFASGTTQFSAGRRLSLPAPELGKTGFGTGSARFAAVCCTMAVGCWSRAGTVEIPRRKKGRPANPTHACRRFTGFCVSG